MMIDLPGAGWGVAILFSAFFGVFSFFGVPKIGLAGFSIFSALACTGLFLRNRVRVKKYEADCNDWKSVAASHRTILETTLDGFWAVELETGGLIEVNDAYARMSGYSREELLAMRVADIEANEKPEDVAEHIGKVVREGSDLFESRHRTREGSTIDVEVSATYQKESGVIVCFLRDVTEKKAAENHLKLLAKVFENSGEAIVVTDSENRIVKVNPTFTRLTGYRPEEVVGENPNLLKEWIDLGFPEMRVSINVSSQEFLQKDFPDSVAEIIEEAGIRPDQLELEITESAAMSHPERIIGIMRALKTASVRLSIDDFGTGYSSLAYLKLFPIDQIKIDRSFVHDLEIDPNDRAITISTIELARKLGLEVVAEGVESLHQSEILFAHGCDLVQGYVFSRPLPAGEIAVLLAKS